MIGNTIRQYHILSRLGAGGMGEVFLAEDERLGRKVALKFLAADLARDQQALERFRNEARLSAGLSHPNIASIHGFEEIDDRWFHVHEYIEGETLETVIARGTIPVADVRALAIDLARGMAHAHSRGVIHRDLKPANIIITPDGTAKILDFGLARRTGAAGPTLPGVAMGTVAYMSPEQIRGEAVDQRCDLWAFGAVLYEALTRKTPFMAPEIPAQLHHILNEEPPGVQTLRPDVPDELRKVVEGCLRKDRNQRLASGEAVLLVLGLSTDLRGATQVLPAMPSAGAPRWPWIVAGVALVAVLAFLGITRFGGSEVGGSGDAMARLVTVEDEFGATSTQSVANASYRQRIALFFAETPAAQPDSDWLARGFTSLVAIDLAQDPFIVAQTPDHFIELVRREGHPDGRGLPRALQRKIAREQGVEAFVTYTVELTNGTYSVVQTVHETESGREVASETMTGNDLFALVDRSTAELRKDLKVPEVLAGEYPDLPVSEICTESVRAYRSFVVGAEALALENDYQLAADEFEAAVQADSTFALGWMSLFLVKSVVQDPTGAEEAAAKAMQYLYRMPSKIQFGMKANYYLNVEQDSDKAVAVTKMWTQLHPNDEDAFRQLAVFNMLRNEPEQQVAALEQVLRIDPSDFNTLQSIGTIYRDMGRFEDAARWLERFVQTYPERASGRIELATLYVDMGKRDLAREELGRALLLDDRSPEARRALADIEIREGALDAARQELDAAMTAASTSLERAAVYGELASLALREGKIREATGHAESTRAASAEALPPGQVTIQLIASHRYYALIDQADVGIARVREDRASLPPNIRNAAGLGFVPLFVEIGQVDSAQVHLDLVRDFVDTYGLEVMRPAIRIYEAMILELKGDLEPALASADLAIGQRAPGSMQLRLRAQILRELGQLDRATEVMELAAKLDPTDPLNRVERARLHLAQNRVDAARAELEAALATWAGADAEYVRAIEARELLEGMRGGR